MPCDLRAALRAAAAAITEHRDELVRLDQAIGDADHGENMKRGFEAVLSALDASDVDKPGRVLALVATTLISKVGGASGPLFGTAFLRAATAVGDAPDLTPDLVATALGAALEGVVARGKAEVGDKTMVDALIPAAAAAATSLTPNAAAPPTVADTLSAAATAAEEGARSTIPLVARKGRASYLGERSAGHLDPGARSTALILRALADASRKAPTP